MKYIIIIAAIGLLAVSCKNQEAVASTSRFKPLNEVKSVSMDAQNYNNSRFTTDTIYFEKEAISFKNKPETQSKFKSLNEVRAIDMGAQNYNNGRFMTDTLYFEKVVADSLKN